MFARIVYRLCRITQDERNHCSCNDNERYEQRIRAAKAAGRLNPEHYRSRVARQP